MGITAIWLQHLGVAEIYSTKLDTHLVCSPFMLCYPLGVLAALRGRELGHPDLTISSAHGQGGVSAVRQELRLCVNQGKGEDSS